MTRNGREGETMRDEELLDRLLLVTDLMATDLNRFLDRHGLTTAKAQLLWTVHSQGACRQRDLAAALGHSPRHVTTLVDELIETGHVTRSPHPSDRRAVLIDLTPDATTLLEAMAAGRVDLAGRLFAGLGADDRRRLGGQLDALAHRLGELIEAEQQSLVADPG